MVEYDLTAMSRLLCFIQTPVCKTFLGLGLGKTSLSDVSRKDLDSLWDKTPSFVCLLAVGGNEMYLTLRKGVVEFDRFFAYDNNSNDYCVSAMIDALHQVEKETHVKHELKKFYLKSGDPDTSLQNRLLDKKWLIVGASMSGVLGLVLVLYFFWTRRNNKKRKFVHVE